MPTPSAAAGQEPIDVVAQAASCRSFGIDGLFILWFFLVSRQKKKNLLSLELIWLAAVTNGQSLAVAEYGWALYSKVRLYKFF